MPSSYEQSPGTDSSDWLMLENTWISLLSFVIAQHFNNTTGCGPFERMVVPLLKVIVIPARLNSSSDNMAGAI
mgnify:CR=1 FL=1